MATYVNDLRLKEIATGDESGTWGTSTNTNLELIAEAFSFGTEGITTNADTHTTTIADGSTDPGRSIFLKYTGTLDSACTITIGPNTVSKLWFIENATSGSQNIIIKQGSGATITIANGQTKAIYSDGAGSGAAMVDAFQDLSIPDLFIDDDLTFTSDSAVITFGADGDTTLTHTDGSGLTLNSTNKLMFNDASQFIQGSSATVLSLGATDEIDLTATAIDINGTVDMSSTLTVASTVAATAGPVNIGSATLNGNAILKLQTEGSDVANLQSAVQMRSHNDDFGITMQLESEASSNDILNVKYHNNSSAGVSVLQVDATNGNVVFNEDSNDQDFRVESNGKSHMLFVDGGEDLVLIGTGTKSVVSGGDPGLQVSGNGFDSMIGLTRHDTNAFAAQIMLAKSRNATVGSNTIVQDGDGIGAIGFFADDGTNLDSQVAYITAEIDGTPGENDTPGRLIFSTTADGAAAVTERMRIDSTGAVRINNTRTTSTNLHVVGGTTSGTVFDTAVFAGGQNSTSGSGARLYLSGCENDPISRGTLIQGESTDTSNGHALVFKVSSASSSPSERLRINSSGFIGVGQSSPSAQLDVVGQGSAANPTLELNSSTSDAFNHSINAFNSNLTAGEYQLIVVGKEGSSKNSGYIGYEWNGAGSDSNLLTFGHWAADNLMNLTPTGFLGIGRTDPNAPLDIMGSDSGTFSALRIRNSGQVAGNEVKMIFSLNRDGSDVDFEAAGIVAGKEQNWTTTASTVDGFLAFRAVTNETTSEKMRISQGNLLVGTTVLTDISSSGTGNEGAFIKGDGQAGFATSNQTVMTLNRKTADGKILALNYNGSEVGFIGSNTATGLAFSNLFTANSSIGTFLNQLASSAGNADVRYTTSTGAVTFDTSSRLVKEDIEDIPYGLEAIKKLSPKKYKRTDGEKDVELGLIADEVVEVIPEIVGIMPKSVFTKEESDTEEIAGSVRYSKLTAVLVKAIQEQQELIETLQTKVAALEGGS